MKTPSWAMILAAGFGKRLSPLSNLRPKPSLELLGIPIIHHLLNKLVDIGVKDVVINLHHLPSELEKTLKNYRTKINLHLIYEQSILGTAGGLKNAILKFNIDAPLLLMHGDIMCEFDLAKLYESPNFCTLLCHKNKEIEGYDGFVGIDENAHIIALGKYFSNNTSEKERGFFTGIHFLSKDAINEVKKSKCSCLVSELYPSWLREGKKIHGIMKDFLYDDLGTKKRLFAANMALLQKNKQPYTYIGNDTFIAKTVKLIPPYMIMDNVSIEENATIGPSAIIGHNVRVGKGAQIENSIVMADSLIAKNERINNSLAMLNLRVLV